MTVNGVDLLDVLAAVLAAGLLRAVPLVVAALGEAIGERAGLLNLGIEGMMLSGSFFGFWAAERSGSLTLGMAGGTLAGVALGLAFGVLTVRFGADQALTGIALTIFGTGLTGFLFRDVYAGRNVAADVNPLMVSVPVLRDLPLVGPAVFDQQVLFWLCWLLVPATAFLVFRTKYGLAVRACGETPFAADAAGVNVARTRMVAAVIAGGAAGLAGAFLCVADVRIFTVNMTVGQGFIALALAMVGRWNPWRIAMGAMLFGILRSLGDGAQILGLDIRTEFLGMVPYLGIMVALVILAGRTGLPSALGIPYRRGSR